MDKIAELQNNQTKIENILSELASAYPEATRNYISYRIMQALFGLWIEPNHTETRLYQSPNKDSDHG